MASAPLDDALLNEVGEEFVSRLRRGECPSVGEYVARYPQPQAQEVKDFLESIAILEDLKRGKEKLDSSLIPLPEVFGRYRIGKLLGEGGMGAVYLAHDTQLDRKVALKTPKFDKATSGNTSQRFYREARSAATLRHPNICTVYDVGQIDDIHYITMAFIEGQPLSGFIKGDGLPSANSAARIVHKVAVALQEAHDHGVIHRDLKPGNIMIDRRAEPIVMDFGLARQLDHIEDGRLTQDGIVIGSPSYMSPEQFENDSHLIGPATDIYSLGVVLYELLTGKPPFQGNRLSIIRDVLTKEPVDATQLRRDLDSPLAAICHQAMNKEIADRFDSMAYFAEALRSYLKTKIKGASNSDSETVTVDGRPTPVELVRAEEQYKMVHSMCQDGQYSAALAVLKKMVASRDPQANTYATWANAELPKIQAKIDSQRLSDKPADSVATMNFGQPDVFHAPHVVTKTFPMHSATAKRDLRKTRSKRRRFYLVISLIAVVVVMAALLFSASLNDSSSNRALSGQTTQPQSPDNAATTITDPQPEAETMVDRRSTFKGESSAEPPMVDRLSVDRLSGLPGNPHVRRLLEHDTNQDGMIQRDELPTFGPLSQAIERFDFNGDNVLDKAELRRIRPQPFAGRSGPMGRQPGFRPPRP